MFRALKFTLQFIVALLAAFSCFIAGTVYELKALHNNCKSQIHIRIKSDISPPIREEN